MCGRHGILPTVDGPLPRRAGAARPGVMILCARLWTAAAVAIYAGTFANGVSAMEQNALLPTSRPGPYPEITVDPPALRVYCQATFEIAITNSGPAETTLVITQLSLANGYSQGYYGRGFTWDTSHITLPASLPGGASLTIPVVYRSGADAFPSRLQLSLESNARQQPHVFLAYLGELCPTPTATPTPVTTPLRCVGDCDQNAEVLVTELIAMVRIVLDNTPLSTCAAGDADGNGHIDVTEILQAVEATLAGCVARLCGGVSQIDCGGGFYCQYPPGTCGTGNVTGVCNVAMKRPSPCSPDVIPVCGCDGFTYPHDCELLIAGVSKAHDGPCQETAAGQP